MAPKIGAKSSMAVGVIVDNSIKSASEQISCGNTFDERAKCLRHVFNLSYTVGCADDVRGIAARTKAAASSRANSSGDGARFGKPSSNVLSPPFRAPRFSAYVTYN